MPMKRSPILPTFLTLSILNCPLPATAEPPPGHPSASQAMEILMPDSPVRSEAIFHQGQVLSATNANQFTYLEVQEGDGIQWIAVPLMTVQLGSHIRYGDGRVMTNFYSRLLQRNFPHITFVKELTVEPEH